MLLIDGVKYELWAPSTEEELEQMVKEHTQEIFGEQSMYLDLKQKLKSRSGIGSIPDGYVIILGDSPQWHIVEVELSSHQLHEHIVSQVSRFINGIKNPLTRAEIVGTIYAEILGDEFIKLKVKQTIGSTEIHKFLADLVSKPPILSIIIEKETQELREAISTLAHPEIRVVEFQTFTREGLGLAVHAHLFEPLYRVLPKKVTITEITKEEITTAYEVEERVKIKDLINVGILKPDQIIHGHHGDKRYEARILHNGIIKLLHNGSEYDSLSMAAHKGILGYAVNGWKWWHTARENGEKCRLIELRSEYIRKLSP